MADDMTVTTGEGPVRGFRRDGARVWLGIPYAEPPVGALRWAAPRPPAARGAVLDAARYGPPSAQSPVESFDLGSPADPDEDCLYLNIWAPEADGDDGTETVSGPLPVMVWIPGGGFVRGAGSEPTYDGTALTRHGVVVVTLNYRLGALGFLDLRGVVPGAAANNGLRDVLLALRWVRDNIAGFGGDPANVTVFGESAGAGMVTALLASPMAAGLFHRAIAQSAPVTSVYGTERARRVRARFLESLGLPDSAEAAAPLRELPAAGLVRATDELADLLPRENPGAVPFGPLVDGEVLPRHPIDVFRDGTTQPVPLLMGTNKDEAAFFEYIHWPLVPVTPEDLRRLFRDLAREDPGAVVPGETRVLSAYPGLDGHATALAVARDFAFRLPTLWALSGHSGPCWLYRFDHVPGVYADTGLGAVHSAELPFVFGTLPADAPSADRGVSAEMMRWWTAFARAGAPEPDGSSQDGHAWPRYLPGSGGACMVIRERCEVRGDLDRPLLEGWGSEVVGYR